MNNKIKLIWDFRGNHVEFIAKHHKIHLDEYIKTIPYDFQITGFETFNEFHSIAYLVVHESDMIRFRDILKPHRAELYETIL